MIKDFLSLEMINSLWSFIYYWPYIGYLLLAILLTRIALITQSANKWYAWFPGLNFYYLTKITGLSAVFFLLLFVPYFNIFIFFIICIKFYYILKRKWTGTMILIWLVILAYISYNISRLIL
jgi:hypothetical protein